MKQLALIFAMLLVLVSSAVGKLRKRYIVTQFRFQQIDSLVNAGLSDPASLDTSAFRAAYVWWPVGSVVDGRGNWAPYTNHFEIFFLFRKGNKSYITKVDNFGYFREEKINIAALEKYYAQFQPELANEEFKPKIDTIEFSPGRLVTSQSSTDHTLSQDVWVRSRNGALNYYFDGNLSANKANFILHRYRVIQLLNDIRLKYQRHKHKRISVVYGSAADIRANY